jgi:hypothetical protein
MAGLKNAARFFQVEGWRHANKYKEPGMINPSSVERSEMHLPIDLSGASENQAHGMTEFISPQAVRFSFDAPVAVRLGEAVMLRICLPSEISPGDKVFIRARARVVGVERTPRKGGHRFVYTASMTSFDFITQSIGRPVCFVGRSVSCR